LAGVVRIGDGAPIEVLTEPLVAALRDRGGVDRLVVTDGLSVVGDMRIHNAEELRSTLRCETTDERSLVLAAFERWGIDLVERVIGDFAFAIVDGRRQRLVMFRDFIGSRPLAYALTHQFFAFASEPSALAALPDVDSRLNDAAIVSALIEMGDDGVRTPYRGVSRLRAGHMLQLDAHSGSLTVRRWWRPRLTDLGLRSDGEYEEAFKAILFEAVRCRLPDEGPIGTDLSGGIDSSSITAVSRALKPERRVVALASSFSDRRWEGGRHDEGIYRRTLAESIPVDLVEVPAGTCLDPELVHRQLQAQRSPEAGVLLLMAASRYRRLAASGGSVLLDGYDGDTAVNVGFQHLVALARGVRWTTLYRELAALAQHNAVRFVGAAREGLWLSVRDALLLASHCDPVPPTIVPRSLLESTGIADAIRADRPPRPGSTFSEELYHLASPWAAAGCERLDLAGVANGIEVRHPYFDRRLVEFCMSLPGDQHFRNGWTRWIVRRSMSGVLPDAVRWRPGKASISVDFIRAYADIFPVSQVVASRGGKARDYLDPKAFREVGTRWARTRTSGDAFTLLRAAAVDLWLQRLSASRW
jgi:asparagine synthase (glutamine-hydrolysing)